MPNTTRSPKQTRADLAQARAREARLRDALQTMLPYTDRLRVTVHQQAQDLGHLQAALERARAVLNEKGGQ